MSKKTASKKTASKKIVKAAKPAKLSKSLLASLRTKMTARFGAAKTRRDQLEGTLVLLANEHRAFALSRKVIDRIIGEFVPRSQIRRIAARGNLQPVFLGTETVAFFNSAKKLPWFSQGFENLYVMDGEALVKAFGKGVLVAGNTVPDLPAQRDENYLLHVKLDPIERHPSHGMDELSDTSEDDFEDARADKGCTGTCAGCACGAPEGELTTEFTDEAKPEIESADGAEVYARFIGNEVPADVAVSEEQAVPEQVQPEQATAVAVEDTAV